jgi:hypothetical protein
MAADVKAGHGDAASSKQPACRASALHGVSFAASLRSPLQDTPGGSCCDASLPLISLLCCRFFTCIPSFTVFATFHACAAVYFAPDRQATATPWTSRPTAA